MPCCHKPQKPQTAVGTRLVCEDSRSEGTRFLCVKTTGRSEGTRFLCVKTTGRSEGTRLLCVKTAGQRVQDSCV